MSVCGHGKKTGVDHSSPQQLEYDLPGHRKKKNNHNDDHQPPPPPTQRTQRHRRERMRTMAVDPSIRAVCQERFHNLVVTASRPSKKRSDQEQQPPAQLLHKKHHSGQSNDGSARPHHFGHRQNGARGGTYPSEDATISGVTPRLFAVVDDAPCARSHCTTSWLHW